MSRIPIKLRVTLVFAAVMALVLAAAGLFLYLRLESSLTHSIDTELQSRSQQLIREMRVNDRGIREAAGTLIDKRADDFAQVLTSSGRLFDPSHQRGQHPALTAARVTSATQAQITFERPTRGGVPERYLARPFAFEGRSLIAVVGASLQSRNDALDSLLTLLLIGGPIALLLASLAAYWTVGSALRPVDAMRRHASEVSASGSQQRLPVPEAQDELRRLGVTLNAMLDRLHNALQRERAFVDDASHELRTPLAAHKAELELALRYGGTSEELRASIASAIEEADRLTQLAESLLVIARSDKGELALQLEPVAIPDVFDTLRDRLGGRAEREGRSLVFADGSPGAVEADRMRLEQALGNLVENALRYGGGTVRVWSQRADGRMEIHVSDEGPGFPSDFLPHAFERFRRADVARSGDGTGLGLAIVKAIAQAHGGGAGARNTGGGGADVWIDLAPAP
ncbi:MAG: HAMP domain-containing protein [Actinobacteria bacterium]|nr:MAG: HAMP domain-containing protein [Actinomycetota bacterium]